MTAARFAFGLLVVGELIQLATVVVGGALYPGYDHARQYISELGATGAVTGPTVSWWGFVPGGLFITAFCLITAWLMRRNVLMVVACLLLAWYGLSLSAAGVYPCAFECARTGASFDAMMHDLFGGTGYLTGVLGVALAGLAIRSGEARWIGPLGLACAVVAAVGFGAIIADVERGGVFQRALEGALAVFLLAFGWALARGALPPRRA
jgi:hypothetical protein